MRVSVNTTPGSRGGCAGKGAATLFFGVFFLMGMFFSVLILGEAWKQLAPWWWTVTDCTIFASGVDETDDDQKPYRPLVRYRYEVGDRILESDRYFRSDDGTASYDKARDRAARYLPGDAAVCRVNPNHPAMAVLERHIPWIAFVVFFPLIFVAIGGGGLYAIWRGFASNNEPEVESISKKASTGRGNRLMIGFGLFFAAIGCAVFVPMALVPSIRISASMTWTATPCRIVDSRLRSWSTDDGTSYRADVLYEYSAGGRSWRSNRVDFFSIFASGRSDARAIVARHPDGSTDTCWVDPKKPARSVLERRFRFKYLLGLIPLIFVLAGVALSNLGWKRLRTGRTPKKLATVGDAVDIGPLVLKPKVGPGGKVAGALFFSLFWNGIVSVFVWQVWKGWQRGDPDWIHTIFLIPFVVVGLGSLVVVGHFVLALANPRPRLTLTPGRPCLDDRLSLEWRFTGRAGRLAHLRIFLEGREEATYRRGTDTVTDREVFATFDLVNTANEWEIQRGTADLAIPADTMHSFEADSNKIIWEIKVEGEIERWPDISQNFPITIEPKRAGSL